MKLPVKKLRSDSWLGHLVIAAIAAMDAEQKGPLFVAAHRDKYLTIGLTVNGVEVDPMVFLGRVREERDKRVADAAARMVHERAGDMFSRLDELRCEVETHLDDAIGQMFPDAERWRDD